MDDDLAALVAAAREAMVNAAKHAGVAEVSVYAEVEPDEVEVFVRDRGAGFDPDAVPDDRHGLAESIRGRMDRHGGTVTVRTRPGEGTEVQLRMPRGTAWPDADASCADARRSEQPDIDRAGQGVPGRRPRAVPRRGARRARPLPTTVEVVGEAGSVGEAVAGSSAHRAGRRAARRAHARRRRRPRCCGRCAPRCPDVGVPRAVACPTPPRTSSR